MRELRGEPKDRTPPRANQAILHYDHMGGATDTESRRHRIRQIVQKPASGNSRSSISNLHSPPSVRQRMGYSDTLGIKRPPQPRQGTNPIQYE